jgi:DNA-binding MarR family transcriptional regulator
MAAKPDVAWLTDDEQACWRAFVAVLLRLPHALEQQLKTDADLTHFEYWVLALVSEANGTQLRLSHLAAFANASLSRVSHVVTRLEKRGLLTRTPCPDERRATLATLTDTGQALVETHAPGHVAEVRRRVFAVLDATDVADLARIANKIAARLDPPTT